MPRLVLSFFNVTEGKAGCADQIGTLLSSQHESFPRVPNRNAEFIRRCNASGRGAHPTPTESSIRSSRLSANLVEPFFRFNQFQLPTDAQIALKGRILPPIFAPPWRQKQPSHGNFHAEQWKLPRLFVETSTPPTPPPPRNPTKDPPRGNVEKRSKHPCQTAHILRFHGRCSEHRVLYAPPTHALPPTPHG
ncbi:hypothetical protein CGERO_01915 [Corynebacterium gerontici]|uniref:Uncharacterized protein n=1 Tax=Corynebacterium gerontici TaxID=2079234 RepID=A0A3G6IYI8_9CORY|nr:hypothetical protein CGERO_01915 [Corynebacterium gerontici]